MAESLDILDAVRLALPPDILEYNRAEQAAAKARVKDAEAAKTAADAALKDEQAKLDAEKASAEANGNDPVAVVAERAHLLAASKRAVVEAIALVQLAQAQAGDRYRFGAEVSKDDPDPEVFDCSELVEWVCGRFSVEPKMPDGSWIQALHCQAHGTMTSIDEALNTPGALLFRFSGGQGPLPSSRPRMAHVAISVGDGVHAVEARSPRSGVDLFADAQAGRWTHAALIPGFDYGAVQVVELIGRGDVGPVVKEIKKALHKAGFGTSEPLKISATDPTYGPKTERVVRAFQAAVGIEVDGVVGPDTRAALGL